MKISQNFQKFFFGVICKQLKEQARYPLRYQHPLTKDWYLIDLSKVSDESIYQLLKLVNPNYPKLNHILPASTKVLTNKHLTEHIKWIELWAAENGLELQYISDEWDRLLRENGIEKEK